MELPPAGGTFRAGAAVHEVELSGLPGEVPSESADSPGGSGTQQAPRSFQTPHSPVVPGVSFWVHHWALYLRPLWETSLPAL